jgi:hypothetical protein
MLRTAIVVGWLLGTMLEASVVVEPPSFSSLVTQAQSILLTEVLETRSTWRQLAGKRVIVTDVVLRVQEVIKGRADAITRIEIIGGMVDDIFQHVAGTPTFVVGDEDVLFLNASRSLPTPLTGGGHGRFRVVSGHNGVGRFIANSGRQPVLDVEAYAHPSKLTGTGARAVSLAQFIASIAQRLGR